MTRRTGTLTAAARLRDAWITIDAGPVITTPATLGRNFRVRLTEDCSLEPPHSPHSGQMVTWRLEQPAAGGIVVTPNAAAFVTVGGSYSIDTSAGAVTFLQARYDEEAELWEIIGASATLEAGTAITQTYSTTTATHANPTTQTLSDSTGGTDGGGLGPINGTSQDTEINNNFATLLTQHNAMRVDLLNVKQLLNQVIDTLQADQKPG